MSKQRITLGTNFYPTSGDDARRQRAAQDSWRGLPDVDLVDLQFERAPARLELPGFRRVEKLRHDSVQLTGLAGKRKPVASEVFDLLAREAVSAGNELFAFANADILLSAEMIAATRAAAAAGCQAQMFSRMDFDGETGTDLEIIYQGQDAFVLDARWWLENRWRFRPYIVGDLCWDDVYTSILLCHAPARLHNRAALVRHERHATAWHDSPFSAHNRFLLTLDSHYFSDWSRYCDRLGELRVIGGGEAQEEALLQASFTLRPVWRERLKCLGRSSRAFGRQWLAGARHRKFGLPAWRSVYPPAGPVGIR